MTGLAGLDALRRHAGGHSGRGLALVAVAAVVVGYYGAWLAGDYLGRLPGVVLVSLLAGYLLVQQPTARAVLARGCYLLAGLVLATPVFLHLPVFTGSVAGLASPAGLVFHPGVFVFSLVFVALAVVLAGAGFLVDDR